MFDCYLFKVLAERRGEKGPSLAYQFQQTMESGDASDKEKSPSNPKRKDVTRITCLKVTSMLVGMKTEDGLQ